MKKFLGRLLVLGAVVGGIAAASRYLRGNTAPKDVAQLTFDDGSTRSFASDTPEGEELAGIAGKLVEMGL